MYIIIIIVFVGFFSKKSRLIYLLNKATVQLLNVYSCVFVDYFSHIC